MRLIWFRIVQVLGFIRKELVEILRQPKLVATLVFGPFVILLLFGLGYNNQPLELRTLFVGPPGLGLRTGGHGVLRRPGGVGDAAGLHHRPGRGRGAPGQGRRRPRRGVPARPGGDGAGRRTGRDHRDPRRARPHPADRHRVRHPAGGRRGEQHDPGPHRGRRPGVRPAPRTGQGRAAHLGDRARLRRRFAGRRHRRAPGRRAGDLGRGRLGAPRRDPRAAGAVRGPARRRPAAAPRRSPHHAGVDPHHGGRRRNVGGRGQGGRRGRAHQRRRAARQPARPAAVGRSRGARAALRRHHARRPRRARGHHRLLRAGGHRAAGATSGCDLRGADLRARPRPGAVRGAAGRPGDRARRACSASTSPTR